MPLFSPSPRRIDTRWLLVAMAYAALVFVVSSRPYLRTPGPEFDLKDNLAHVVEYAVLAGLVGWVLFRAADLDKALGFYAAMLDFSAIRAPDSALRLLLSREAVAALALGSIFALPVTPWIGERLRLPRLAASPHLPTRLDPHGVHVLSVTLLAGGLLVSVAKLAGSSLNPFLYFRF